MEPSLIWILVAVAVMVAVGGFLLFQRSKRPKEEPVYRFQCDGCKRRLKYTARQAGHSGMCPQCKKPLKFPAVSLPKQ